MALRNASAGNSGLASIKIGGAVPAPKPRLTRSYAPKGSEVEGLHELVLESYNTGKNMVIAVLPGDEDLGKQELLAAKNWLMKNPDSPVYGQADIRGVEKAHVEVIDVDAIDDPREKAAYRKLIPKGFVGLRFQARPPLMKGRAVEKARQREAASKPRRSSTRKGTGSSAQARSRAARTEAEINSSVPTVPFSG